MAVRHDVSTEYQYRNSGWANHNAAYTTAFRCNQPSVVSTQIWVKTGHAAPGGSAYESGDAVVYNAGGEEFKLMINGTLSAGYSFTWPNATFVHVCVVRESTTSCKLYINGTLGCTSTVDIAGRNATAHEILGCLDTTDQWLNGAFDGYCEWNVALNATEVATQSGYLNPAVKLGNVVTETRMTAGTVAAANVSQVGTSWTSAPNDAALSIETGSGAAIYSSGIALAGGASSVATPAGAITTAIRGAGASLSVSTPAGSLTTSIKLGVAVSVVSSESGRLSVQARLSGSAIAQSVLSAALSTLIPVGGSVGAQATAGGALINWGSITVGWTPVTNAVGYRFKIGTSPGVYTQSIDTGNVLIYAVGGLTPGVTYYWTVVALHSGGDEGIPATEGSGTPDIPGSPIVLQGAAISSAVATAALGTKIQAAGTVAALTTVVGALQQASAVLAGTTSAVTTPSGAATTSIRLAGQSAAASTVQGAINAAAAALDGLVAAQSAAQGSLTVTIAMHGSALASALASAGIETSIPISGLSSAVSSMLGTLVGSPESLAGASLAQVLAHADLTSAIRLSAVTIAESMVSGGLSFSLPLSGFVQSVSSVAGSMSTRIALSASSDVYSRASGFVGYDDSTGVYGGGGLFHAYQWWDRLDQLMEEKKKRKKARARRRRRFFY